MPTLEGRIVGVEEKQGGYFRFETDTRPRFLDTKRDDLIDEGYALLDSGEVAVIRYSETEGRNINPNTGQPYTNRYYEGTVTGGNGRERAPDRDREPEPRGRRRPEPVQRERSTELGSAARRESRPNTEPPQSFQNRTHPESAWRMAKTSGSERAVQTLPLMPTEQRDFDTQKAIALAWAEWIMDEPRRGLGASTAPARGAYDEPDFEQPPPLDDEDIPF